MKDYLPGLGIALFFWCLVDYRLHWLAALLLAWALADLMKGAF